MSNWSIRKRLWIVTIVVVLGCATAYLLIWVPRVTAILIEAERREIQRQVDIMVDGLTPFILSNQHAAVYENLLSIAQRHGDWRRMVLTRADGRQLYPLQPSEPAVGQNLIAMSQDIVLRGHLWGRLDAQVDLTEQVVLLHNELRRLGFAAFIIVMLSAAAFGILIDRLITRRLNVLADAADELGAGNFEAEIPDPGTDEVGRLASSFSSMRGQIVNNVSMLDLSRQQAESALVAKSQFLATMSHELRTPLNGILPIAELLKETKLDAEQQRSLDTIVHSSKSLLRIVDDILDLTKIEEGRFEPRSQEFDLVLLIERVAAMLTASAESKGLKLITDIKQSVAGTYVGDEGRIDQILVNLVGNAIKFTNEGTITIRCRNVGDLGNNRCFLFEVVDTGIGISEDFQERVFERFEQAEGGRTRRFGGSGLGLSISKNLVNALGGDIGLKSAPGYGSTFWFNVSLTKCENATGPLDGKTESANSNSAAKLEAVIGPLAILIADDNEINREVTTTMLEKLGHNVTSAKTGREALDKVAELEFKVVFMDVHMPEMDGLEATRGIRALGSEKSDTYVVALTASVMEQDVIDCQEAGMNEILSKPVSTAVIEKAIQRAVLS